MAFYSDFAGYYDAIFPVRPNVLRFLEQRLPSKGRVLDVGCGTGACCGALAAAGRTCLGIDLDPGMIGEAEHRHPEASFKILGMEEIGLLQAGTFAGIICLGNVLPHLSGALLPGFISAVHRLLQPGGVWIFQTVNFDPMFSRDLHVFPVIRVADSGIAFHRSYESIRPKRLDFVTALLGPDGEIFRSRTTLHPLESGAYRALHAPDRWELVAHDADFDGRPFDAAQDSGSVWVWSRR